VDDIIFGGSSHTLLSSFQKMMENKFQMSIMGELTFFLGIQVKQTKEGIFIHHAKYTKDLIKKINMAKLKPVSTLMITTRLLTRGSTGA
jgi:DNA-binding MurR/RpiR family transcriptional regulator